MYSVDEQTKEYDPGCSSALSFDSLVIPLFVYKPRVRLSSKINANVQLSIYVSPRRGRPDPVSPSMFLCLRIHSFER